MFDETMLVNDGCVASSILLSALTPPHNSTQLCLIPKLVRISFTDLPSPFI